MNSYARYWDLGQFAPGAANWGFDNRTLRDPRVRVRAARVQAARRERQPVPVARRGARGDGATGSRDGLDPGPPQAGRLLRRRRPSRGRRGRLPRTLGDALALLAADEVVAGRVRRGRCYDAFVEYKTDEWERFCAHRHRVAPRDVPAGAPVTRRAAAG